MLTIVDAKKVLDIALSTGCDFAEIYYEDTYESSINLLNKIVDSTTKRHLHGVGIRLLKGYEEVYGYTTDRTLNGMITLAEKLSKGFNGNRLDINFELKEEYASGNVCISTFSKDVKLSEKLKYPKLVSDEIYNYSDKIVQAEVALTDKTQHIIIANTLGKFIHDFRNQQRVYATAVSKSGDRTQSISSSYGGNFGAFDYEIDKLKQLAINVASASVTMVDAPEMIGGVYPVVMHNGFGGVLFHEACGHSLEATFVSKGLSVFSNKLGQKVASSIVTAIDDGSIYNEWGSQNIDDDGNKMKKNVLIENGILKSYMIDEKCARKMNTKSTCNSRRQSYRYSPTSRMTNTYIQNGTSTFEEIIKNTKYGLFAKTMGGGSVNPVTGEFNFAVNEGYMIEDGKITHPVRGATLIGNGSTALLNIDMIANNQTFGHGMCGSISGSIPANVGQPTIRILNMTVGGRKGE